MVMKVMSIIVSLATVVGIIYLIGLIVAAVRGRPKKPWGTKIGGCFLVAIITVMIGMLVMPPEEKAARQQAQEQQEAAALEEKKAQEEAKLAQRQNASAEAAQKKAAEKITLEKMRQAPNISLNPELTNDLEMTVLFDTPEMDFKEIARYPDKYEGSLYQFPAKISYIYKEKPEDILFNAYVGNDPNNIIYIYHKRSPGGARLLARDDIRVYGVCAGVFDPYKAGTLEPLFYAHIVEIK